MIKNIRPKHPFRNPPPPLSWLSYVDDARNTDNAWVETMAINFHDDDGTLLRHFQFRAGESVSAVAWLDLEFGSDFEPSTSLVLRLTAQKLGAAF